MSQSLSQILAYAIVLLVIALMLALAYFVVKEGTRGLKRFFHIFKWLLVAIVGVFVVGLFGGIGVGGNLFGDRGTLTGDKNIAMVLDRPVTLVAVRRQLEQYKSYGIEEAQLSQFAPSIIEGMISGEVEQEAARRSGVEVSDAEMQAKIKNELWPAWGVKDFPHYLTFIERNYGFGPDQFEAIIRDDMRREKYERILTDSQVVTDDEARKSFLADKDTATADVMQFDAGALKSTIAEPSESEVQAAYQANLAKYQYGERRAVRVLAARANDFSRAFKPNEADLKALYIPKRQASHILIAVKAGADAGTIESARKQAEDYAKRARAGEDFASLAGKFSDDPGSKVQGGDLGWFAKEAMVPEFSKAVFETATAVGQIVGPIKSQFGWHVIKLTGLGGQPGDFEAARAQLEMKWKASPEAQKLFKAKAEKAKTAIAGIKTAADLDAKAKELGLEVQSSEQQPIEKGSGFIPGIGVNPKISGRIFAAKAGELLTGLDLGNGELAVAVVTKILPAGPKPLQEVRFQVVDGIKTAAANQQAQARAAQLQAQLAKGGTLKEAATRAGFIKPEPKKGLDGKPLPETPAKPGTYFEVKSITLNAGMATLNDFPDEPGLKEKLLAGQTGQTLGPLTLKSGVAIFRLTARNLPVESEFPGLKAGIIASLKQKKSEVLRTTRTETLRKELQAAGKIKKNRELIAKEFPQQRQQGMPPGMNFDTGGGEQ